MSITDEAVELFADRASRVQPGFTIANHNAAAVGEICRRLNVPLASSSLPHRCVSPLRLPTPGRLFRLLAGVVRGRGAASGHFASIDWSHAPLTETEQILFRRLAPFVQQVRPRRPVRAVAAGSDLDPFSVLSADPAGRQVAGGGRRPPGPAAGNGASVRAGKIPAGPILHARHRELPTRRWR